MGREAPRLDPRVLEYKERVGARWHLDKFILFGSRARGDALEDSDFDVILVSTDFQGVHFIDRMVEAGRLWEDDLRLDVICYTPEEFARKAAQIGTVQTAVREGIAVV